MRILIYGAGVIGSIFATKFSNSGQDITVLARGKRYEELKEHGCIIQNANNQSQEVAKVKVIQELLPDDKYDYIMIVMQRNQVDAVLPIIKDNCSQNIIFVVNTALGYDKWIKILGKERIMIGFPSAGGERNDGIITYFVGKGYMRLFQTTTFGDLSGSTERLRLIVKACKKSGIPTVTNKNMNAWQKTHVALVTCIGNALYHYDCKNTELAKSYRSLLEMVRGMKEGLHVLNKLGYKTTPFKLNYFKLPACLIAVIFKAVMSTKLAEFTMAKHCIVARKEMQCLQGEFDLLVTKSRIKTPNIKKLKMYLG